MIAPTDVTDPPNGWSWAQKHTSHLGINTGEYRYIVSQDTPKGYRQSSPLEREDANKLMVEWNQEAKKA